MSNDQQIEFSELKKTFPWTEQTMVMNGVGGIVRMVDNAGNEVPLFHITGLLQSLTRQLMNEGGR